MSRGIGYYLGARDVISLSWHNTVVTIERYSPRQASGICKSIKQVYQGILDFGDFRFRVERGEGGDSELGR